MSVGNPHTDPIGALAKSVNYNKQELGRMVQDGRVDHAQALLAGMRIDRMRESMMQAQAPAGKQPTVFDKTFTPQQQGIGQLAQAQQAQAPQQQAPTDGGVTSLPVRDGMFSEESYAGGGIIAFDEGGDVPGFATGAYLKNPVGKYFNPSDLTPYDDETIQEQLRLNPNKTMEQIRADQDKLRGEYGIKNIYDEQRTELEKDKAENEKFKEQITPMAGLKAAAALLGNKSQYFGVGAGEALKEFGTEYASGQKEYKATKKDIRNLGFEIGRADQAMRQAEMTGDQSLFNSERARRDGLLKQAQDVKFKNIDNKNATFLEGAKAGANYDTNMAVANAKAKSSGAGSLAKVNASVLDKAQKMMAAAYPAGSMDTLMRNRPDVYQAELNRFITGADTFIKTGEMPAIPPSDAVTKLLNAKPGAAANVAVDPSASTKATIAGKKVDPKLQSLLNKYPAAGSSSTEDEDEE